MAEMKHVITLTPFTDLKEGVKRKAGDEFDVTAERFEEINAAAERQGFGRFVNETPKEPFSPASRKAKKEQ